MPPSTLQIICHEKNKELTFLLLPNQQNINGNTCIKYYQKFCLWHTFNWVLSLNNEHQP